MSARRKTKFPVVAEAFPGKQRKPVPYAFVLDAIASLSPYTRPMFGCLAVYVGERIVLILRDKATSPADNGVWLATTKEKHESLRREFPTMRSIGVLGKPVTGWQVLPADAPDFETAALRACELVLAGDGRIGKVPGERRSRSKSNGTKKVPRRKELSKKVVRSGELWLDAESENRDRVTGFWNELLWERVSGVCLEPGFADSRLHVSGPAPPPWWGGHPAQTVPATSS